MALDSHRVCLQFCRLGWMRLYPPRGWRSHKQGAALKEGLGHLGHVLGDALRVTRTALAYFGVPGPCEEC